MEKKRLSPKELSLKFLKPYTIPKECPYLSEEQKELSKLPYEKRLEWWADWLYQAHNAEDYIKK
ncbi:MAG: hypothetical protein V1872_06245 [bacterium]